MKMPFIIGSWKSVAFRGAAALLFGVLALIWPGITLLSLVFLFGIYALSDGISILVAVFRKSPQPAQGRKGLMIFQGVVSILSGIIAFVWPGITALALLFLIAAWALVTGALEIAAAIKLRREITNEWLLGLAGALSIVFGMFIVIAPPAGALAVTWIIGWYAMLSGVLLLALAFRIRKFVAPLM
jgi:uncharacterized membrane protein HdeD (DUF308 family)